MKKYFTFTIFILCVFFLGACSQSSQDQGGVQLESQANIQDTLEIGETQDMGETIETQSDTLEEYIAYIESIEGDAMLIGKTGNTKLEVGSLLRVGDRILTLKQSEISLIFEDDSVVRLGENSSFTIESVSKEKTKTVLNKGSLWGRILRPIGSENNFEVVANDVSATVRGTSLFVEIDEATLLTEMNVFDSYSDEGVVIVSQGEEILLQAEEQVVFGENKKIEKNKIDISETFKQKEFIRKNTREDIIYMKRLLEKEDENPQKDIQTREKIEKEVRNTIPSTEEMQSFFVNNEIVEEIQKGDNNSNIQEDIIARIFQDEIISDIKKNIPKEQQQERISQVTKDNFRSEKIQETIDKAVQKSQELNIQKIPHILEKSQKETINVRQKIEIQKKKDVQEIQNKSANVGNIQMPEEQETIESNTVLQRNSEEAKKKKQIILEQKKLADLEKQKEQQKIIEVKKQEELKQHEVTQKQVAQKEEKNISTPLNAAISKTSGDNIASEIQEVQPVVHNETSSTFEKNKSTLIYQLGSLQEHNIKLLELIAKHKEQLRFSVLGKVLPEDEQFAREILGVLSPIKQELQGKYNPELLKKDILLSETQDRLNYYTQEEERFVEYHQKIQNDLGYIGERIQDRRTTISQRTTHSEDTITEKNIGTALIDETGDTVSSTTSIDKIIVEETPQETENIENQNIETVHQNTTTIPSEIQLSAKMFEYNGYIELTWNTSFGSEDFKIYKVLRSSEHTDPLFATDKIGGSDNKTSISYKDTSSKSGNNYYKVCILTLSESTYCSNTVRVENLIDQKIQTKKAELGKRIDTLVSGKNNLLSRGETLYQKLDFSSLVGVRNEDIDFSNQKKELLSTYKNEIQYYPLDELKNKNTSVTQLSQFDTLESDIKKVEERTGIMGENIHTLEYDVQSRRETILARPISNTLNTVEDSSILTTGE